MPLKWCCRCYDILNCPPDLIRSIGCPNRMMWHRSNGNCRYLCSTHLMHCSVHSAPFRRWKMHRPCLHRSMTICTQLLTDFHCQNVVQPLAAVQWNNSMLILDFVHFPVRLIVYPVDISSIGLELSIQRWFSVDLPSFVAAANVRLLFVSIVDFNRRLFLHSVFVDYKVKFIFDILFSPILRNSSVIYVWKKKKKLLKSWERTKEWNTEIPCHTDQIEKSCCFYFLPLFIYIKLSILVFWCWSQPLFVEFIAFTESSPLDCSVYSFWCVV